MSLPIEVLNCLGIAQRRDGAYRVVGMDAAWVAAGWDLRDLLDESKPAAHVFGEELQQFVNSVLSNIESYER